MKSTMTLQSILRQHPSRHAVSLLSGTAWTFNHRGYSLEQALQHTERAAAVIIETQEQIRTDIVWPGTGWNNLVIRALGGHVQYRPQGAPQMLSPLIHTPAEGERLDISRIANDQSLTTIRDITQRVRQAIGETYLVGAGQWGPFTLGGLLFGTERLMRSLYRVPAVAHVILTVATDICYHYLEALVHAGATIISLADPSASGDMISRRQFETYVAPYHTQLIARLHVLGVSVLLHICGNTANRLDLMAGSGADIVSVDYKVDLKCVKAAVGSRAAFAGNLDPVHLLAQGTPTQVFDAAKSLLGAVGGDGNFLLMPGCDLAPTTPLANVQALALAAHTADSLQGRTA
jgi:uroporphyrinogen decarboxylase